MHVCQVSICKSMWLYRESICTEGMKYKRSQPARPVWKQFCRHNTKLENTVRERKFACCWWWRNLSPVEINGSCEFASEFGRARTLLILPIVDFLLFKIQCLQVFLHTYCKILNFSDITLKYFKWMKKRFSTNHATTILASYF